MTGGISEEIDRLRELTESHLAGLLPDVDPKSETLLEAMRYTLGAPGKRIRPALLFLACRAARGAERDAIPYACAVEFIHNYSLIHDDLPAMDDDDIRRGKPANHKVFGEGMAILAGDGLLSAAFELMHKDYLLYMDDAAALKRRLRAGEAIVKGCGCRGMVAGQAADIEAEGRAVSAGLLDYIHVNKTAALIRAAVEAGAWLGGAAPGTVRALSVYGENLGLVFQIVDDILDTEGETGDIGKTAGKDARDGKATYPALHGLEASRARLDELTERAVDAAAGTKGTDENTIGLLKEMAYSLARRVK